MRLICLNTSGGKLCDRLLSFVRQAQETTEILCLQEVFNSTEEFSSGTSHFGVVPDLYQKLIRQLRGFQGYLTEPSTSFGERLAIFAKSTIVSEEGDTMLCEQSEIEADEEKFSVGSRLQWVTVRKHNRLFTVANVHGIWLPAGKNDTPERVDESEKIAKFLQDREGAKILCGDFNLLPKTRSVDIIEKLGMRNLIKEFEVTSTRSSHYPSWKEKFADYVFTSPEVTVREFKVLQEEVSDHLPLLLEFE